MALTRTAKSCRSDAPMLASSLREEAQATVSNKPGHRGEREVSRKTIARGMPGETGVTVVTMLVCLFYFACEAAGASSARHSLRHLNFRRRDVPGNRRAKPAARSRSCALNRATQKHSSCPGLTRASIYFARAFSKQMDCRVKPGNDILMAFARNTRRDRKAVSRHGGLFENRIHSGRHCEERKRRNLIRRHSGDGPKDQTSDARLRSGESRDSGLDASRRH